MLRNLNRSTARGRILGTSKTGVLGSAIPASGANGPGYAYNDLTLPADANKEICGRVTSWPATGTLFAYEDTSFDYTPAGDGVASFAYQLYVDGVAVGTPQTVTLSSGAGGTTINATVGSAVANGMEANVALNTIVLATVGTASAVGLNANIAQGATITASVGAASANGLAAAVMAGSEVPTTTFAPSAACTVHFAGGTNTVAFDGGTNRVNF